jgi:glycosyltransferase involved in cell wall biosynthesis
MKTTVLQLISSTGHYGAEHMVVTLCEALNLMPCRPILGMIRNSGRPNMETVQHAKRRGLQVEVFDCIGRLDWRTVKAIQQYSRENKIDVIHTHGYKADIYGFAAACELRLPTVATCHSSPVSTEKPFSPLRLYHLLDAFVLRRCRNVAAVSEKLATALEDLRIPKEGIVTIPNGISISQFSSASPSFADEIGKDKRAVVGMIARLVSYKGADFFLKAAQMVLKSYPDTVFVLVGEGPTKGALIKLANELNIASAVIFAGHREDMPEIYAALDLVVLPSLSEGLPMTILEAFAAGKPVIATRVGGIPTVIQPEKTGLLVEPGDVRSLSQAIEKLLGHAGLRKRLGMNGQSLVRSCYSAEMMAGRYLAIYRSVINTRLAA